MPRRSYTPEQKAKTAGLAVVHGVTKAAEMSGVPKQRVSDWLDKYDPGGEMRTKSREKVAEEMWAVIQIGVQEVSKGIQGDAPLRDKVVAVGVLYDKFALLTGSATARTESRDITGSLSDADLVGIVREAERIASAVGAAPAPSGETEA
jgi:transposase-like protein